MIWLAIGSMQRVYRYWKRRMLIRKRYGHDPMKQFEISILVERQKSGEYVNSDRLL